MTMAGWPLNKGTEYYGLAAAQAKEIMDNKAQAGLVLTAEYSDLWKEDKKTETNEVMFALQHSAKHKIASNYGKSYYPSDYSPNAGWADYYGNEDFFKAYPNDDRKEWNYMTEWKIKSGEIIPYTESADKLPAISKYYDYDEGAPVKCTIKRYNLYLPLCRSSFNVRRSFYPCYKLCEPRCPECYPGGTETRRLSKQANRTDHNNRTCRILNSRIQRTRLGILCRNETLVRTGTFGKSKRGAC